MPAGEAAEIGNRPLAETMDRHASHPIRSERTPMRGRVLIVDDSRGNVRMLQRMLAADGHTIRVASDGDEALRLIGEERPDVVLMDVMMPQRDGFATCRVLKEQSETRLIPVVLVTA